MTVRIEGATSASNLAGRAVTGRWRRKNAGILLAFIIGIALALVALFGSTLSPFAPSAADFGATLLPPFWQQGGAVEHVLGTDQLGRGSRRLGPPS